jgi:low affinity Fe/Cu permease
MLLIRLPFLKEIIMAKKSLFTVLSQKAAYYTGHPSTFFCALGIVVLWGASGPIFGFNNTWQLVINTATTIITFLMVFLIQSTQNRDTAALQLKLDELIRATNGAHTVLLDLEELSENDLEHIRRQYEELARKAREGIKNGKTDTGPVPIDIKAICERGKDL